VPRSYKVGERIIAKIGGIPHEATIRAVIDTNDGLAFIVDFGQEQVATVAERDIIAEPNA
jgi:hypothetical protein